MKRFFVVLGVATGLVLSSGLSFAAGGWTGNLNLTLGGKYLDDDDWDPVENQGELGISLDFRERHWPVNLYLALLGSAAEDTVRGIDVEGSTSELRFGVRKIFDADRVVRPFIGGGLAFISAEMEGELGGVSVSDDDSGVGLFISGGIYFTLEKAFNLGVEVGYSAAKVDFLGVEGEAGGAHAALLLGYHW
ncbi:MAG TPA: hypothetical protein PKM41_03550 [Deltaproteobacteria bacterium]|nr:hypothetical protein [Deltaproteobacteria bacterium]HOI06498.1 hypothetical protein [Deltaproteobacteria bacterium]